MPISRICLTVYFNLQHAAVNLLKPEERITVSELRTALKEKGKPVVIDVRSKTEFDICRLPGSVNIPLADIEKQSAQNTLKAVISKSPNPNEPGTLKNFFFYPIDSYKTI